MFGQDRFGPDEDYGATYRSLGGGKFSDRQVRVLIDACLERMTVIGRNPARYNDFPSVDETLDFASGLVAPDRCDRALLARVIARHEIGVVPIDHADALRELARSHRLGVVSNIWSNKALWCQAFGDAEIDSLFDAIIWSSDARAIKPSSEIFERAIAAMDIPRERIVFVGDNPSRDVVGAKQVGLAAIWINDGTGTPPEVAPDLIIKSLTELVSAEPH